MDIYIHIYPLYGSNREVGATFADTLDIMIKVASLYDLGKIQQDGLRKKRTQLLKQHKPILAPPPPPSAVAPAPVAAPELPEPSPQPMAAAAEASACAAAPMEEAEDEDLEGGEEEEGEEEEPGEDDEEENSLEAPG